MIRAGVIVLLIFSFAIIFAQVKAVSIQDSDPVKSELTDLNKSLYNAFFTGDTAVVIESMWGIGKRYFSTGNSEMALYWFNNTIAVSGFRNYSGSAAFYLDLSAAYLENKEYKKSEENLLNAVEIARGKNDKSTELKALVKLAQLYFQLKEFSHAEAYYMQSLELENDSIGKAEIYNELGCLMLENKKYDQSEDYLRKSLEIYSDHTLNNGVIKSNNSLAELFIKKNNFHTAKIYADAAMSLYEETNDPDLARVSCYNCYVVYNGLNDFRKAYSCFEKYNKLNDSILDLKANQKLFTDQLQFDFRKKILQDSLKSAEEMRLRKAMINEQNVKIDAQNTRNVFLGGGIILSGFLFLFVFQAYRSNKKRNKVIVEQKLEAEKQKEILELKNREIVDSIQYAKRLQEAILPSEQVLSQLLQGTMVFYQPRDIVAGDFYWTKKSYDSVRKEEKTFFAVADCTGHGVPGSMVSVVCSNALTRAVQEFHLTETGKILDKVSEIVEETFSRSNSEVKDGMDISIVSVIQNKICWSGANNPLCILSKKDGEIILTEIKPDKQPVGKFDNRKPFTTHELHLDANDELYLFTDGYADQFGGEGTRQKKFRYSKMKELFISLYDEPLGLKQQVLKDTINKWKGDSEQVDDICIAVIKIPGGDD